MNDGTLHLQKVQPEIILDDRHRYFVENQEYTAVTAVTSTLANTAFFTEYNRKRGSAAHLACELDDLNDLDETTLDSAIYPYLSAYREFKTRHECIWTSIEQPMINDLYHYAGKPDRIGTVDGKRTVLDLKTGGMFASYKVQLAAYAHLTPEPFGIERMVLQLDGDGKPDIIPKQSLQRDFNVFISALTVYRWKKEHGI